MHPTQMKVTRKVVQITAANKISRIRVINSVVDHHKFLFQEKEEVLEVRTLHQVDCHNLPRITKIFIFFWMEQVKGLLLREQVPLRLRIIEGAWRRAIAITLVVACCMAVSVQTSIWLIIEMHVICKTHYLQVSGDLSRARWLIRYTSWIGLHQEIILWSNKPSKSQIDRASV